MENSEFALKKKKAIRRKLRNRAKAKLSTIQHRLVVFRSNKYFYGQVIDKEGYVVASASTAQKSIKSICPKTWGREAIMAAGKAISDAMKAINISIVNLDRGQYVYTPGSKIAVFADAIREQGIKI